jgi:molybdate transport system substrate-binding protein
MLAASSAVACTGPVTGRQVELQVYAAASLADVLDDVALAYADAQPGVRIQISTDSSAALRTKIELGAPADLFLAADIENPERLVGMGLAVGPPTPFAANRLVIALGASTGGLSTPADLARPGVRIVAAGEDVPITAYARDVVARLAELPGYPPDFASAYETNVVSREDNVRAVLAKIELGEADAGFVYATDARSAERLRAIELPVEADVAASYGGVVLASSLFPEAARGLLDWLAGSAGQVILERHGFEAASSPESG